MTMVGTHIGTFVRPETKLTPLLRFGLKLLQAPRAELDAIVAEAIIENPFIEEVPREGAPSSKARRDDDSAGPALDSYPSGPPSLQEELLSQLRHTELSPVELRVGESIIGNLDDDGFLEATIEDIARQAGVSPDLGIVERVLARVQEFDPPGIAARDRPESFVLQLRRRGFDDLSLPVRLVREYLSPLVRRPLDALAAKLGVSTEELRSAARLVARLDPSPGRENGGPAWIVPDVAVRRDDGDLVVVVNDEGLPRLRLRDIRDRSVPLRAWRQSARLLLMALAQRRETLEAVTKTVVRAQRDFLEGRGPLRPLALRDVAGEIGRHESTVCRAIADKYVETPRGTFALKSFFARKTDARGDASADQVKARIAQLLAGEDRTQPLTDDQIVRRLREEGVQVSRRTVGKYREELGVPAAAGRRVRPEEARGEECDAVV
jgi:RNA polymerase sigma-54 factor